MFLKGLFSNLETALADADLDGIGLDAAELRPLAVGQVVQGVERDVEAGARVVHCQHRDRLARPRVRQLPARAALCFLSCQSRFRYSRGRRGKVQ